MKKNSSIYEKTYKNYLAQLDRIDLIGLSDKLGINVKASEAIIPPGCGYSGSD